MISFPGAVPASGIDTGVTWHFGEPLQESRALAEGGAFADLSHLGVVTVTGPDRLPWLHAVTTQGFEALLPGAGVETMALDPWGRIRHAAAAVDDGATCFLITESPTGLAFHLEGLRFRRRVTVTDATAAWAVLGDSAATGASVFDRVSWLDPWPGLSPGDAPASGTSHPGTGWRWRLTLVPRAELDSSFRDAAASGLRPVGTWATEANRIAAWRPRATAEAADPITPNELDWLRTAIDLDKGPFPGREGVLSILDTGRAARRLTYLHLDGSDHLPARLPAVVALDGFPVGQVTSVALHHDDGPIALALLKRTVDPKAALTVAGADDRPVAAAQTPIVGPSGQPDHGTSDGR